MTTRDARLIEILSRLLPELAEEAEPLATDPRRVLAAADRAIDLWREVRRMAFAEIEEQDNNKENEHGEEFRAGLQVRQVPRDRPLHHGDASPAVSRAEIGAHHRQTRPAAHPQCGDVAVPERAVLHGGVTFAGTADEPQFVEPCPKCGEAPGVFLNFVFCSH